MKKIIKKIKEGLVSCCNRNANKVTTVQTFPLNIHIYKGENRILIIPIISHEGGFSELSHNTFVIDDTSDCKVVGSTVINTINFIKNSPCSTSTSYEREKNPVWKENSKYNSEISFWRNNLATRIQFFEDGHYQIYSMKRSDKYNLRYDKKVKEINLPKEAKYEDLGQAVIDVFSALEEYYKEHPSKKIEKYSKENIELLNGSSLTFQIPKNSHFIDSDDCGAAEIYKCYSYIANEGAESSAEFFLGIGAELDCDLSTDNIKSCFEEYNGKADYFEISNDNFGIFNLKAEMKNKSVHKISYYLQIDEDEILECSMEVHQPNKRKKVDEKLTTLLQEFALSCMLEMDK